MYTTDQIDLVIPVSTDPATVINAFADYLRDADRSIHTVHAFSQDVNSFTKWCTAEYHTPFTLDNFNRHDLRSFQRWNKDQNGVSPSSWNRRMSSLHAFSSWLQKVGLLSYDPTDVLKYADAQSHAPRWMTDQEYRAFTIAVEKHVNTKHKGLGDVRMDMHQRDYAAISLMLYAGLRVAEVCALDVGDVLIGERSGTVIVRLGKGRKQRRIPLSLEARAGIKPWMELRQGLGPEALFVSENRQRLTTRTIQRLVAELGRIAQIDRTITPHALRHTFAKRMVNEGVRIEIVKELLGHTNLNTTFIYVQPGWDDLADAVEKI